MKIGNSAYINFKSFDVDEKTESCISYILITKIYDVTVRDIFLNIISPIHDELHSSLKHKDENR